MATNYLSIRDKRGFHLKMGDTVRFFDGERRVVGWVERLSEGRVFVRYPKTLVPVVDGHAPTSERAAVTEPEWAYRNFLATEVERWG